MPELERRFSLMEVRDVDAKQGIFSGYFSNFGSVDSYDTIFNAGCFAKTMAEWGPTSAHPRIKCAYQHDPYSALLGKPLVLEERSFGAYHETKVTPTTYGKDVLLLIEDGVLNEQSFAFESLKDIPAARSPDGKRHLTEVRLYEYGPVTWGANENTPITDVRAADVMQRMQRLDKHLRNGDLSDPTLAALMRSTLDIWTKAGPIATAPEPRREVIQVQERSSKAESAEAKTSKEQERNTKRVHKEKRSMTPEELIGLVQQCRAIAQQCAALLPTIAGNQANADSCRGLCANGALAAAKCIVACGQTEMSDDTMEECAECLNEGAELFQRTGTLLDVAVKEPTVLNACIAMMQECIGEYADCIEELAEDDGREDAGEGAEGDDYDLYERLEAIWRAVRNLGTIMDGSWEYARYEVVSPRTASVVIEDRQSGDYFKVSYIMKDGAVLLGDLEPVEIAYLPKATRARGVRWATRNAAMGAAGGHGAKPETRAGKRHSAEDTTAIHTIHGSALGLLDEPDQIDAIQGAMGTMSDDQLKSLMSGLPKDRAALVLSALQSEPEPGERAHSKATTTSGAESVPAPSHTETGDVLELRRRELDLLALEGN
ncbi:MAG TPA: HK97 family phage prohead protease [Symbiobacteriaceae bacterium]|jgi:hypothetical protein